MMLHYRILRLLPPTCEMSVSKEGARPMLLSVPVAFLSNFCISRGGEFSLQNMIDTDKWVWT